MKKIKKLKKVFEIISFISMFISILFFISLFIDSFTLPSWIVYIFPIACISLSGWYFCMQYINKNNEFTNIINNKNKTNIDEINNKSA